MNDPYQHRKYPRGGPPGSDEDHGSERTQSFGAHQDVSTHHYHSDNQYPIQHPTQHTTQHMYPGQYGMQQPAQQPTQQLMQDPTQQLIQDREEYSEEDQYEGAYEESLEDPSRYFYQVSGSHQMHDSYPTVGLEQVTESFHCLGLTSTDDQPGPSQLDATSRPASTTWGYNPGPATLPDPEQNPFGPVEQPVTGFELFAPGTGLTFGPAHEWEVRRGVALGLNLEEICRRARRPLPSVQRFIVSNGLTWTRQQDAELGALVDQGSNIPVILEHLNVPGGPTRLDYEVEFRVKFLGSRDYSAQQAEPAGNPQPDPQGYPEVCQPGETMAPQAAGAKTKLPHGERRPWSDDEIRKLGEWRTRHPHSWKGVENEIPGRGSTACGCKWARLCKAEEARHQPHATAFPW